MARHWNRLAFLAKTETTYGVDSAPTGAANAIELSNVTVNPLEGQSDARDLMRAYLGNQGKLLTANHAKIEFSIEAAGSGTAGTAPAYGPLLRACRLAEVVTPATSVAYLPVSGSYESVTGWMNLDGVRHRLVGARGTVSIEFTPSRVPRFRFQLWGLLGAVEDAVLPAASYDGFRRAIEVSKANTTLAMHGVGAMIAESVSFDLANQVEPRFLIGSEAIVIPDRTPVGRAVIEALPLSVFDPFARARARTRGAVALAHGVTAGNILTVAAAATEIDRPAYGQTQGITNTSFGFDMLPVAGDDEVSFTFT